MASPQNWITLAHIVRPQGRRGEVLADLSTDFPDLFTGLVNLCLRLPSDNRETITVENYWMPTGRNAGRIVLKVAGIDTISAAEKLAHCDIQMPSEERLVLDENTYYVNDPTGCAFYDGDVALGTVRDIQFPADPQGHRLAEAAPIFVVVRDDGGEVLVPFANAFIKTIDVEGKRITTSLPAGLLELNG